MLLGSPRKYLTAIRQVWYIIAAAITIYRNLKSDQSEWIEFKTDFSSLLGDSPHPPSQEDVTASLRTLVQRHF